MSLEIEKKVIELICSVTGSAREQVQVKSTIDDIQGWDSLSNIKIVCGIEEMIGRKLTLEEMISALSVNDWVTIVRNNGA